MNEVLRLKQPALQRQSGAIGAELTPEAKAYLRRQSGAIGAELTPEAEAYLRRQSAAKAQKAIRRTLENAIISAIAELEAANKTNAKKSPPPALK